MDYDPALKQILTFANSRIVERLAGAPVRGWLNVELQETTVRRADLLAELENGELFHLELQSANFPRMGKRMLDYRLLIEKKYGRIPWQMVLYVGMEPLAMSGVVEERDLAFRFGIMDIRQFDARRYTIHILEHRFGPLPAWAREKIQATPKDQLEALLDRVLDAPDLNSALGT